MCLSPQSLLKLERKYHHALALQKKPVTRNVQYVQDLLEVRPKAYYQRLDEVATAVEWKELDQWNQFLNHYHIHFHQLPHYNLMYGKHHSKKCSDIYLYQTDQIIPLTQMETLFNQVLQTYYREKIHEFSFVADYDAINQFLILEITNPKTL